MDPSTTRKPARELDQACFDRREEILEAATALFAEHGFTDAVTQDLVDKLQVGKGTLYRHFPSKRELFLSAVDRVMRLLRERLDAVMAGVEEPLERLTHSVSAYLLFFAEHPCYVELLIQERALFKDRIKPTYFEHREKNMLPWREVFRRMIGEGRVREMPVERITDVLCNMVYGTMFTNHFTGLHQPPQVQARDILEIFFYGILSGTERQCRGVD